MIRYRPHLLTAQLKVKKTQGKKNTPLENTKALLYNITTVIIDSADLNPLTNLWTRW